MKAANGPATQANFPPVTCLLLFEKDLRVRIERKREREREREREIGGGREKGRGGEGGTWS